jgi:3-methyladenine DNA glycosylase Tag
MPIKRCPWSEGHALLTTYHDEEWGVPVHDDRRWYEKIVLDGAQAGPLLADDPQEARRIPRGVR